MDEQEETYIAVAKRMLQRVNATEWRGHAPGTLLVVHFLRREFYPFGEAVIEHTCTLCDDPLGWNNVPWKNGKRYAIVDSKGRPLYDSVEFEPESRDLRYEVIDRNPTDFGIVAECLVTVLAEEPKPDAVVNQ